MARRQSHAVEILPGMLSEYVYGSIKSTTFRIMKNGRNMALEKVKQPNKTGANPDYFKSASQKWGMMMDDQKCFWKKIAKDYGFWSNWTAFMSSFLKSVHIHGLEQTMANEVKYIDSQARFERYKCYANSIKRNRQYQVDPDYYPRTEETLENYPIAMDSPLNYVRLLDIVDVNNALRLKLLYRSDPIIEYQFFPDETGEMETGYYIKLQRERQGHELYELFN